MNLTSLSGYVLMEKIGSGNYGTVYKACKKDGCRDVVAIKYIQKRLLSKSAIDNLTTEIHLLKVLKHEHIVEMKDFFWDDRHIEITMEYCDGGDLSRFISNGYKLTEKNCQKILQQLALALKHLREHNVCHMDLKPQNLLLIKKPVMTLKVGDFGFSQYLSDSEERCGLRGTPPYMAPEMLLKRKYDARVDLWSVGVIMYQCLFGATPYPNNNLQELVDKLKECRPVELPKGSHISAPCKDLLMSLLKHDPTERISFDDFFAHEFLDLEHAPIKENYQKAMKLVESAVVMDDQKNTKEAFHLYCQALRYFIPLLTNESDPEKKKAMRAQVNVYIERAEVLKASCIDNANGQDKCSQIENKGNASSVQRIPSLDRSFTCEDLRALSKSTPAMADALEIGEVAVQYLMECNYVLALEKFQSCLGILIHLLGKEPPGRRRELLHKQVQIWMKEAENTKALLAIRDMSDC